ncbi:protocatechuate 3,4-dioxygenase beta subunit [Rhodopirellula rubra]|uniref:Protocatechuate 3,4-dioxygenase beta subunit n=1 Tax=Aporhodopirellula rubra TaxID=980271 RepID=A0A7W5H488_9BACT|nr:protocatechuate 3,4-dioxygenase [Aporhodopirellula rubra]MBB3204576.1 protocatechuate 3,4-dioxygenase beta subunit [Aporhodopirellula rubra]
MSFRSQSWRSSSLTRRSMLAAGGATLFTTPGAFAEELLKPTPRLTEGPFYPDRLPLDQDNDLIVIGDGTTPAVGEITHLTGRVLTPAGSTLRGATVEIWQCDANAVYLHSQDSDRKKSQQDQNFQGYGKFETASDGGYRFRTIKPVPYPGRPAPHIHIKVSQNGHELLTTQLLIRGHEGNVRDGVFRQVRQSEQRDLLLGDFKRVAESKIGELSCNFDIILGKTPADAREG